MKVLFSNVGRRKVTFSADIPAITHRTLLRCVRPHLMSQNIEFLIDNDGISGTVIAGFHAVGSFRVEGGISLSTIILEERPDEAEIAKQSRCREQERRKSVVSARYFPLPRFRRKPRANRHDDPDYLNWIRSLGCVCCVWRHKSEKGWIAWFQTTRTEAAHVGMRGLAQKCSDRETIPLCALHHRTGEHAHHVLGKRFWTFWKLDRYELIRKYNRVYENLARSSSPRARSG